jgi:hypothetical protein
MSFGERSFGEKLFGERTFRQILGKSCSGNCRGTLNDSCALKCTRKKAGICPVVEEKNLVSIPVQKSVCDLLQDDQLLLLRDEVGHLRRGQRLALGADPADRVAPGDRGGLEALENKT